MTTPRKHYLLVVEASPIGDFGDRVRLALVHVSPVQAGRWSDLAGIVRSLSRGDSTVCNLSAWCNVDFHDENPVAKDHPDYDAVEGVLEGGGWCLVEEGAIRDDATPVRTDADIVNVWAAKLVFCGQSKHGNDLYESTWVEVHDLVGTLAAKA